MTHIDLTNNYAVINGGKIHLLTDDLSEAMTMVWDNGEGWHAVPLGRITTAQIPQESALGVWRDKLNDSITRSNLRMGFNTALATQNEFDAFYHGTLVDHRRNNAKITAIRDVRTKWHMGLGDAKVFMDWAFTQPLPA